MHASNFRLLHITSVLLSLGSIGLVIVLGLIPSTTEPRLQRFPIAPEQHPLTAELGIPDRQLVIKIAKARDRLQGDALGRGRGGHHRQGRKHCRMKPQFRAGERLHMLGATAGQRLRMQQFTCIGRSGAHRA